MAEILLLKQIREKAALRKKTLVLPESHDERVLKAAEILTKEKVASVITIGSEEKIRSDAAKIGVIVHRHTRSVATVVVVHKALERLSLARSQNTFSGVRNDRHCLPWHSIHDATQFEGCCGKWRVRPLH